MISSIPVLGTEPASENRIRSCCGSAPGIWFCCKPVTLVRCREIGGENRFSGRVVGKWLCEMTSAFIIKELRGSRALRLFCGRSSIPPILPVCELTQIGLTSKPQKLFTRISRVSGLPPTIPHTEGQNYQWVKHQERFKTSSKDFSEGQRECRCESDS